MSDKRISGKNFHIFLSGLMIKVSKASLSISDNSSATSTHGVPDGWVDGDVSAEGELELTTHYFNLLNEAARIAGSWKALDTFDITMTAIVPTSALVIEAFECKLKISDLLDIDPKGGDPLSHKLPFEVTGSDFVKINGVPYIDASETIGLF